MTDNPNPDTNKSSLEKLIQGLLTLSVQKQISEPEHYAIGRISHDLALVNRRHSYAGDVERLLKELEINSSLISRVEFEASESKFTPEELINYHLGAFFDLVHQLKDKIRQLVRLMMLEETPKNPSRDPGAEALKKYFKNPANRQKLEELGLLDPLSKWSDEDKGPIGKTLARRTIHHHYLARLELSKEFQQIQLSRHMLNPTALQQLSPYGKQYMAELGTQSFTKFKDEVLANHAEVVADINRSVNKIAERLISGFAVPVNEIENAKVFAEYPQFLKSFEIQNEASLEKLNKVQKATVQELINLATANKELASEIVAIYLVGSVPRGEFKAGISDVNYYLITKHKLNWALDQYPLHVVVLDNDTFLSSRHKKDRFICWSDGVLVYGEPLDLKQTEFPKPGSELCLLLNEGYIQRLQAVKAAAEKVNEADTKSLRHLMIRAVKIMLDFDFGVAMSNRPYYTASRSKKIEHTKKAFTKHNRTEELERILYSNGILTKADLIQLIDIYVEDTQKNYDKIVAVVTEFDKKPED